MSLEINQVVAVVLAGGFGTRIKHLLKDVPKPMAEVAGKPFVEWVVRYLAKQGIRRVILSNGHLSEAVESHFHGQPVDGVNVTCVEETQPLGTGGGFLNAVGKTVIRPPAWLVLNGDSLVFANLNEAARSLDDPAISGVIIGRPVPDASRYGTLAVDQGGDLLRFEEKRSGSGVINGGVYLLRNSLLEAFPGQLPLSLERDVFPFLLSRGFRLRVATTEAPFLDIGTPETLPLADAFIRENASQFA